jgi:hypothetical protein
MAISVSPTDIMSQLSTNSSHAESSPAENEHEPGVIPFPGKTVQPAETGFRTPTLHDGVLL